MQGPSLRVGAALARAWCHLAVSLRGRITAFLAGGTLEPGILTSAGARVRRFAEDLERGAPALRAAFPDLVRELTSLDADRDRLQVRISSHGTHDGHFFDYLVPTGRNVTFEELHTLRIARDEVVEHRVEIDHGAIIRQLGRTPRPR